MDLTDLQNFLVIAQSHNLQRAAGELHKTAGALSKSLKRLEHDLQTQLFDRRGRNLQLNSQGERLQREASRLVHEAMQLKAAFTGSHSAVQVNIAGPAVILQPWLAKLLPSFPVERFSLKLFTTYEGAAIEQLLQGQVQLVLATQAALPHGHAELQGLCLGQTEFVLAVAPALAANLAPRGNVKFAAIAKQPFACPLVSPFCGQPRGRSADGWRDDEFPRHIAYRCDEINQLVMLVQSGHALAYLPVELVAQHGLQAVQVEDYPYQSHERIMLWYRPSQASGWLMQWVHARTQALAGRE